jgi:hypothetical protein
MCTAALRYYKKNETACAMRVFCLLAPFVLVVDAPTGMCMHCAVEG